MVSLRLQKSLNYLPYTTNQTQVTSALQLYVVLPQLHAKEPSTHSIDLHKHTSTSKSNAYSILFPYIMVHYKQPVPFTFSLFIATKKHQAHKYPSLPPRETPNLQLLYECVQCLIHYLPSFNWCQLII